MPGLTGSPIRACAAVPFQPYPAAMPDISSHDTYLATLRPKQHILLAALRATLRQLLADATEVISSAMPGCRMGSKVIAGYAGFARHCGFYLHSGRIIPGFAAALQALGFKHSKSGVLFTPSQPLPDDLLSRIVAARRHEAGLDPKGTR